MNKQGGTQVKRDGRLIRDGGAEWFYPNEPWRKTHANRTERRKAKDAARKEAANES